MCSISVEVQTSRLQNVESRRTPAALAALAIQFATIFGVRQRRAGREGVKDVCQRTGSELSLPRDRRDAADDRREREKASKAVDCAGQRRRSAGLSLEGRQHGFASRGRERLLRGCVVSAQRQSPPDLSHN